jgi:hypothetical protein
MGTAGGRSGLAETSIGADLPGTAVRGVEASTTLAADARAWAALMLGSVDGTSTQQDEKGKGQQAGAKLGHRRGLLRSESIG